MKEAIKRNGIMFGIILGMFSILIRTIIYIVNLELITSFMLGISIMVANLIIFTILLLRTKKEMNGNITFKEAFTTFIIAAFIGTTLAVSFDILLFNVIDPAAKETIKELSIKSTVSMLQKFDTPQAKINETIKSMTESDTFSVGKQLLGLFVSYIISSIIGLIFAAFFKTKTVNY